MDPTSASARNIVVEHQILINCLLISASACKIIRRSLESRVSIVSPEQYKTLDALQRLITAHFHINCFPVPPLFRTTPTEFVEQVVTIDDSSQLLSITSNCVVDAAVCYGVGIIVAIDRNDIGTSLFIQFRSWGSRCCLKGTIRLLLPEGLLAIDRDNKK